MDDWRERLGGRRCLAVRALHAYVIGVTRQGWDAKESQFAFVVRSKTAGFRQLVTSEVVRKNLVCDGGAIRVETAFAAIISSGDTRGARHLLRHRTFWAGSP
jgi:hypothetical protein